MGLFKNVGIGSKFIIQEWIEKKLKIGSNHYEIHDDNTISMWDHLGINIDVNNPLKYQINTTNIDLYFNDNTCVNNYKLMPYNSNRIIFYHCGLLPDLDQFKNYHGYTKEFNFVECKINNIRLKYPMNKLMITDSSVENIIANAPLDNLRLEHCDIKNIQLKQNVFDDLIITNCNIDNIDFFRDIKINNKLRFFNNSINLTIDDLRARNIIYNPRNVKLKPQ